MFDSFATSQTVALQAPPSMDFPGKNAEVDCHSLLQGIFLAQESNTHLLHWQVDSLPLLLLLLLLLLRCFSLVRLCATP